MNGLGAAKDPAAAYSWILAASKAGDHRGDAYLQRLEAQLNQRQLSDARAHSESVLPSSARPTTQIAASLVQ
jgi:uncharacterized protein HemY